MNFFNKIEQKYSKYAVCGLMKYLLACYIMGILIPDRLYYTYLSLDMYYILKGQVYRLLSFMIYPPSRNLIFFLLFVYVYYNLGNILEYRLGSFRFNLYIFSGILFHIIGSLLTYLIFRHSVILTPSSLNLSIFLAFAFTFPDMEFRLYFILPIRAKVLGIIYLCISAFSFLVGGLSIKLSIIFSLLNFFVFYYFTGRKQLFKTDIFRKSKEKTKKDIKIVTKSRVRTCKICARTSESDENLEFRYCSKCKGNHEYCMEHIFTHIHINEE